MAPADRAAARGLNSSPFEFLTTSDVDERDHPFISGDRTPEGFFRITPGKGVDYAIARSLAYAPYADLLWWETSEPNLEEAERFADRHDNSRPRSGPRPAATRVATSGLEVGRGRHRPKQ